MMYEVDMFSGAKRVIVSRRQKLDETALLDKTVDLNLEKIGIAGDPYSWSESAKTALALDICQELYDEFMQDMHALKAHVIKHGHLPNSDEFRQAWREEIAWMWGITKRGIAFDALMQINGVRPQLARDALLDNFRADVNRALDELNLRVLH